MKWENDLSNHLLRSSLLHSYQTHPPLTLWMKTVEAKNLYENNFWMENSFRGRELFKMQKKTPLQLNISAKSFIIENFPTPILKWKTANECVREKVSERVEKIVEKQFSPTTLLLNEILFSLYCFTHPSTSTATLNHFKFNQQQQKSTIIIEKAWTWKWEKWKIKCKRGWVKRRKNF